METLGADIAVPPKFLDPLTLDEFQSLCCGPGESPAHIWEQETLVEGVEARVNSILDDAVERSRRSIVRFPKSARAYTNLGLALLNRGHLDEAASEFERAIELDPRYVHATAGLGQVRLLQGQLDEAQAAFTKVAEVRPAASPAILGLASVALQRGHLEEVTRLLERVVEMDPESTIPRYHLGMVLVSQGRVHDAISELREAVGANPRLAILYVGLGRAYAKAGDWMRALRQFRIALSLMPGLVEASHGLARALVEDGQLVSAISILDDLLANDPSDNEARELRAWANFRAGEFKKARQDLHRIITTIDPLNKEDMACQARLLNNLGTCYWSLGNWEDAKPQFARSISLGSATPTPYHNLGRILLTEQQPGAAITVLRQCRAQFPSDTMSGVLLVRALDQLGRIDEAIETLNVWVTDGNAPSEVWALLGYLLTDRKRDPSSALEVLREAHERFPGDPAVANNLAYAYLMLGDIAEARRVLEELGNRRNQSSPFRLTATLHATWGLLHLREGNLAKAVEGYKTAEEIAQRQGDSSLAAAVRRKRHLEFARMMLAAGNMEAAKNEIRLGLKVTGDDSHHYGEELKELSVGLRTDRPHL